MAFSKETIYNYLKRPHFCPYCNGTDIVTGNYEPETQVQDITCENCGKTWNEVFQLTGIEEI